LSPARTRITGPEGSPRPAAAVAGLGCYAPAARVTNADLEARVDTTDAWIVERTGIRERRAVAAGEATSDMAVAASRAALADAGVPASAVDTVIVATCTPDQPLPATAVYVANALGLRCPAFDLVAACSGFVYGLVNATALIAAGAATTVLLAGADTLTNITDPLDRTTCVLFGDAAGAAVVSANRGSDEQGSDSDEQGARPGLLAWDLGSDGSAASILQIPAGGSRRPASEESVKSRAHFIQMEGREVFRRAVRACTDSVNATLARAGVGAERVALFVPHQANARIVEAILGRIGVPPERTFMNIDRYGNTSAASIPVALAEAMAAGRLREGDLVLMSGFGGGLTWGSALLRWGQPWGWPARPSL